MNWTCFYLLDPYKVPAEAAVLLEDLHMTHAMLPLFVLFHEICPRDHAVISGKQLEN
jgi:hypothetical protein